MDFVIKELELSPQRISMLLNYQCPKPETDAFDVDAFQYHRYTILGRVAKAKKLRSMKKLASILGDTVFADNLVKSVDDWDTTPLERAVDVAAVDVTRYILAFKAVKVAYANDMNLMYRLVYFLFARCNKEELVDYVMNQLQIYSEKMRKLVVHKYAVSTNRGFGDGCYEYEKYSIVAAVVKRKKNAATYLKKLRDILGDDAVFANGVFLAHGVSGNDALKSAVMASVNNGELVEYLLSINEVKQRCLDDKAVMHGLLSVLNENYNEKVCECVVNRLAVTSKLLNELKAYKAINIDNISKYIDSKQKK